MQFFEEHPLHVGRGYDLRGELCFDVALIVVTRELHAAQKCQDVGRRTRRRRNRRRLHEVDALALRIKIEHRHPRIRAAAQHVHHIIALAPVPIMDLEGRLARKFFLVVNAAATFQVSDLCAVRREDGIRILIATVVIFRAFLPSLSAIQTAPFSASDQVTNVMRRPSALNFGAYSRSLVFNSGRGAFVPSLT